MVRSSLNCTVAQLFFMFFFPSSASQVAIINGHKIKYCGTKGEGKCLTPVGHLVGNFPNIFMQSTCLDNPAIGACILINVPVFRYIQCISLTVESMIGRPFPLTSISSSLRCQVIVDCSVRVLPPAYTYSQRTCRVNQQLWYQTSYLTI